MTVDDLSVEQLGECLICGEPVLGEPGAMVRTVGDRREVYCAQHAHRYRKRPKRERNPARPRQVKPEEIPAGQSVAIIDGEICLTAEQRKEFFAGRWPELAGLGKPPEIVRHRYELSDRLAFTVSIPRRTRKGWRLEVTIHDDREERYFLLRTGSGLALDERGRPLDEMPPEEDIGYTRNPKREGVIDPEPGVRPDIQNVLVMRAKLQDHGYDRDHRAEQEAERHLQRAQAEVRELVKRAVHLGVDPALALARVVKAVEESHDELEDRAA